MSQNYCLPNLASNARFSCSHSIAVVTDVPVRLHLLYQLIM